MSNPSHEPGAGKSTADKAFGELTRGIAERNERAHKEMHALRVENDRKLMLTARAHDASRSKPRNSGTRPKV
jgi:hypothetical protein